MALRFSKERAVFWLEPDQLEYRHDKNGPALRINKKVLHHILEEGINEPVVVRENEDGKNVIVGHGHFWLCAVRAKVDAVPIVKVEDTQMKVYSAREEYLHLSQLQHYFCSVQDLSKYLAMTRSMVHDILSRRRLAEELLRAEEDVFISKTHLKLLYKLDKKRQRQALEKIIKNGWSCGQLRKWIRGRGEVGAGSKEVDADILILERKLSEQIGSRVGIDMNEKVLKFHFDNLEVFDGLLEKMNLTQEA